MAKNNLNFEQFFFSLTLYRTGIWIVALEMICVNFNLDKTFDKTFKQNFDYKHKKFVLKGAVRKYEKGKSCL